MPCVYIERKNRCFSFPCYIADSYLKLADGPSLKLIIYLLGSDPDELDIEAAARSLGLTRQEVLDAILFWEQLGVLFDKDPRSCQEVNDSTPQGMVKSLPQDTRVLTKRSYTASHISQLLDTDSELRELFSEAERSFGRVLKHSEHELLISLRDYYGFSVQSCILIIEYCQSLDKSSVRYIESVARDFSEKNILGFSEIEAELERRKEQSLLEGRVARSFGMNTSLTKKQTEFVNGWKELGFGLEMMTLARDRCVDSINKLSFGYIDKVLKSWADKGIFTPEAASLEKKPSASEPDKDHSINLERWDDFTLGGISDEEGRDKK